MSFVSYAQNFEDVVLWRALHDVKCGHYIDIGAQEPEMDSVSLAFYEAGWRGIHVEPTPTYAARLRGARPDEVVIEAAVSDAPGPIEFFELGGLSSGRQDIAEHHRAKGCEPRPTMVPTIRLDDLLDVSQGDIHWLKIDVEGMEPDVLRSWGQNPKRPWILVIEATYPTTEESTRHLWIDEVSSRGYVETFFDGLSRYFVHEAHADLRDRLNRPANVFDDYQITAQHYSAALTRGEAEAQQRKSAAVIEALKLDVAQERQQLKAVESERAQEHSARLQLEDRVARLDEESAAERSARVRLDAELLKIARAVGQDPDEFEGLLEGNHSVPAGTTFAAVKTRLALAREELDRSRELALEQFVSGQSSRDGEVGFLNERISATQDEISTLRKQMAEFALEQFVSGQNSRDGEVGLLNERISATQDEISTLQRQIAEARDQLGHEQQDRERLHRLLAEQGEVLAAIRSDSADLDRQLAEARDFLCSIYGTNKGRFAQWLALVPGRPPSLETRATMRPAVPAERIESRHTSESTQQVEMEISLNDIRHTSNLLALNGSAFVDALYRTLLKRSADRAGRDHYIGRLQAGVSKESILLGIAGSPEARAVGTRVEGIAQLKQAAARARRWSFFNRGARAIDQRLNKLEYSLGEAQNSLVKRLEGMESAMEHVQSKIENVARPVASGRDAGVYVQGVPVSLKQGLSMRAAGGAAEFIDELRDSVQGSTEALSLRNGR